MAMFGSDWDNQHRESLEQEVRKLKHDNAQQEKLIALFRGELLWLYSEVWPLVHGLTSRDCVKQRFKRLPDIINTYKEDV